MKIKTLKLCCALSISLMLAACGGGKDNKSALDNYKDIIKGSSSSNSSANAVGADTLQAIEFDTAVPATLTLKGTGGSESSWVTFRVVGKTGLALKGVKVNFVLNSAVGDLKLSQDSSTSDDKGIVFTSVISGRVSTSVRVTATANSDPSISAQSSLLVVATGLPEQKSMSIAAEHFNPPGWNHNDIQVQISVLLADAYNNPVADNTAISFTTEGGSIVSKCTTLAGGCSATWRSQSPRPTRNSTDNSTSRILCLNITDPALLHACQAERAGRITILATAIGNESFKDGDGTGIFDKKYDVFKTTADGGNCLANVPVSSHESATGACDDLPEAYLDINESGTREPDEFFVNFITDTTYDLPNSNGAYDNYTPNNGKYNGAFCQDETLCSRSSITIRKDLVLVMSCDTAYTVNGKLPRVKDNSPLTTHSYALADCNGNALPIGTKITIGSADEFELGSSINGFTFSATPGTLVKLEVPIGESSNAIITNYTTE